MMAHYAFLNSENIVVKVITGVDETVTQYENDNPIGGSTEAWEEFYASQPQHEGLTCKRTSYNSNIRGIYASIGFSYNVEEDIFVEPKPYPSWTRSGYQWQPPTPMPEDDTKLFTWNEPELRWEAREILR